MKTNNFICDSYGAECMGTIGDVTSKFLYAIFLQIPEEHTRFLIDEFYNNIRKNIVDYYIDYSLCTNILQKLVDVDDVYMKLTFADSLYAKCLSNISCQFNPKTDDSARSLYDSVNRVYDSFNHNDLELLVSGESNCFRLFMDRIKADIVSQNADCFDLISKCNDFMQMQLRDDQSRFFFKLGDDLTIKYLHKYVYDQDKTLSENGAVEQSDSQFVVQYLRPVNSDVLEGYDRLAVILGYMAVAIANVCDKVSYGDREYINDDESLLLKQFWMCIVAGGTQKYNLFNGRFYKEISDLFKV